MNEDKPSLFPLNDVLRRVVVGSVGIVCFGLTLITAQLPFCVIAMFAVFYLIISSLLDDAKGFSQKIALVRCWTYASLHLLTGIVILADVLIEGSEFLLLWVGVAVGLGYFGWNNIAVAVLIRGVCAQVDAQMEAERQEKANQDALEREQAKEVGENHKALLESLAFLNDIDPKSK